MATHNIQADGAGVLAELLPDIPVPESMAGLPVHDLVQDSRHVRPGAAFIALQGSHGHGLSHAADAAQRGASLILWDEGEAPATQPGVALLHVPGLRARLPHLAQTIFGSWPAAAPVVAVTGTDGKTTVSHLVAWALEVLGWPTALIGTLGVGRPGRLTATGHTTPGTLELHRHLAALAGSGCRAAALEASSHGLAQGRLAGIPITVAVLTRLGSDHLDFHGSQEAYAAAKARLFAWPGLQAAVLNADDPFGRQVARTVASDVRVLLYSASAAGNAELRARDVEASPEGLQFTLETTAGAWQVRSRLFGLFQVSNLLATLAALQALGIAMERAVAAVTELPGVAGRMERFSLPNGALAVVDYAHTAAALQAALEALRPHASRRLSVVFGCGGERDRGKRAAMGRVACVGADTVLVTDDNPRSEDPAAIRAEIIAGCDGPARCDQVADRAEAIARALHEAEAGDVVLVAGKGHETTQEVQGVHHPFSDREAIRAWVTTWYEQGRNSRRGAWREV